MLKSLASHRSKKKDPPKVKVIMQVYCSWLKKYLDWFDPDLYLYLQANADGIPVKRFPTQMAAEMEIDYQFSGVVDNDPLIVPLPKLHQKISTDTHKFGEVVNGRYYPYCHDRSGTAVIPTYNTKLTASCNPNGFEYVPVARLSSDDVPAIHVQITGIRADIQKVKRGICTLRWLGLQDSKYVSLPTAWVETNFHQDLLAEAIL